MRSCATTTPASCNFYERHAAEAVRQGVQHLAKRLADSAAAPAAEPCAWSEQLHAAAAPSAAFADQLRAVSALFDVGVTSEIKVRVPLGFSGKGYTSFPLPDPFVDGEWSQQWPDDLVRLASVAPTAAEIERLERIRLPSAAEAAETSRRVREEASRHPQHRKRRRASGCERPE